MDGVVPSRYTSWVRVPVEVAKLAGVVAVKTAVRASVPAASVVVVHVATPAVMAWAVHPVMAVPLDLKPTVPVAGPPEVADTVAVRVTDVPNVLVPRNEDEVSVVVVVEAETFWVSGDEVELEKS